MNLDEKKDLIKKIKSDKNLTETEKSKKIQEIMMGNYIHLVKTQNISNNSKTCSHYNKQCYKFYFECCEIYDPCKRCHIERNCCALHEIKISSITCSNCDSSQEPRENCVKCNVQFSQSHCRICQIWTEKQIYHCVDCGICRVGTKETLFHCTKCKICFNKSDNLEHKCTGADIPDNNNTTQSNLTQSTSISTSILTQPDYKDGVCVICSDSTFNSQSETMFLHCGHLIHTVCYEEYLKHHNYKCPYCKKSFGNLKFYWDIIRNQIKLNPLPNDFFPIHSGDIVDSDYGKFKVNSINFIEGNPMYTGEFAYDFFDTSNKLKQQKNIVSATLNALTVRKNYYKHIHCNDCCKKSTTPYHFYGLECKVCGSFNTQE